MILPTQLTPHLSLKRVKAPTIRRLSDLVDQFNGEGFGRQVKRFDAAVAAVDATVAHRALTNDVSEVVGDEVPIRPKPSMPMPDVEGDRRGEPTWSFSRIPTTSSATRCADDAAAEIKAPVFASVAATAAQTPAGKAGNQNAALQKKVRADAGSSAARDIMQNNALGPSAAGRSSVAAKARRERARKPDRQTMQLLI